MVLPHETLKALSNISGFWPTEIDEHQRVDLTEGPPFLAIDGPNPHEVDDAIRIDRLRKGGFLVEIAIADGFKLDGEPNSSIVGNAVALRHSTYRGDSVIRQMLPTVVTKLVELRPGINDALVIRQKFNADGERQGDADVVESKVRVLPTRYRDFGVELRRDQGPDDPTNSFLRFYENFRRWRGLKERKIGDCDTTAEMYAKRIVATSMVVANIAVAEWAKANDLPIIFREFFPRELDEDTAFGRASYTTVPTPHFGLAGYADGIDYTHVTSPLRRASDLINHLQIGNFLAGTQLPYDLVALNDISAHLSSTQAIARVA